MPWYSVTLAALELGVLTLFSVTVSLMVDWLCLGFAYVIINKVPKFCYDLR